MINKCLSSQPHFKDLTGQTFGNLKVISRGEAPYGCLTGQAFWLCQCICGNTKSIRGQSLRSGQTRSCGCLKRLPAQPGLRSGRLTVIVSEDKSLPGDSRWLCKCDCGQMCVKLASEINSGRIRSCGCLRKKRYAEAAENAVISAYKQRAKQTYKLPYALTKEQAHALFKSNCHYCGCGPSQEFKPHLYTHGAFIYNGIDRIDSKKGYVPDNVVSCCGHCNHAKLARTYDEFILWLKLIAKKWT